MTSMLSEDDIQNWLWRNLRNSADARKVDEGLRLIRRFAVESARKWNLPPEYAMPGEEEACMLCGRENHEETLRCQTCGQQKRTAQFYRNASSKTGYDSRCKACKDCREHKIFKCRICHNPKPSWNFPPGKMLEPKAAWACLDCRPDGIKLLPKAKRLGFKCRNCKNYRQPEEFPEGKIESPARFPYCTECDDRIIKVRDTKTRKRSEKNGVREMQESAA